LKTRLITRFEDFLKLENQWNILLERSQNDTLFLRHEWFKCWWKAFGKDKQLFLLLAVENDELVGIAPLMITNVKYRGLRLREIGFLQDDNSPRSDLISLNKEALNSIIRFLKDNNNLWDIVSLKNIPKDSETAKALPEVLKQNKLAFLASKGKFSPYITINSGWQAFISDKSSKFRKVMRNKINRVKRLGEYTITKIENINGNKGVINSICDISEKSWKAECNGDIARSKENKYFFEELSSAAGNKGWLNIWLLNIKDNHPIAYEYHLKYKNKAYALRADFDETYRDFTPGSVLEYKILEETFNDGVIEYDFCGNAYGYKMNWADNVREHVTFEIFGSTPTARLLYGLENFALPIARRLKNHLYLTPHSPSSL
jgi:CelD/BcsL family acetyltransferase involved in cellulose biosynthesis